MGKAAAHRPFASDWRANSACDTSPTPSAHRHGHGQTLVRRLSCERREGVARALKRTRGGPDARRGKPAAFREASRAKTSGGRPTPLIGSEPTSKWSRPLQACIATWENLRAVEGAAPGTAVKTRNRSLPNRAPQRTRETRSARLRQGPRVGPRTRCDSDCNP